MSHCRYLLLSFAVLLVTSAAAAAPSGIGDVDALAHSKYWLRLLHYKTGWFFHTRSLVDGPEFFFSPEGRTDPRAELLATVAAFSKDIKVGRLKQHPQCAFPERYRFLKAELKLTTKDVACPAFQDYMAKFNAQSATLVFSSAYPNNPGSMFGHTLLRINAAPAPGGDKNDLLDWGLSYAAQVPPDDNGAQFIVSGLIGGYRGAFTLLPYYAKVNEYTNSESRDLWEYDLALTPEQTRRMLAHVWELETTTWLDYYFFDENCSYMLLALLEVARPDWDLTDFSIYVIPGETVKAVARVPGAITRVKYRPSLRKKLYQRLSGLDGEKRRVFFDVIDGRRAPNDVSDRLVLEGVLSYLFYLKQKDEGRLPDAQAALLQATLLRRSDLGAQSKEEAAVALEPIREDTRPDRAHDTYRVGTAGGFAKDLYFQEWNFRFAYHDLLNDDMGYTRFSEIEFPGATVRLQPSGGVFNVEHIEGLAITSLEPMTFLETPLSWMFNFDYYSPKDLTCTTCHLARGEAGFGATLQPFTRDAVVSALAVLDFEVGSAVRKGYRWGPQLQTGVLLNPFEPYKMQLAATLASDLAQPDRRRFYGQLEWNQSFAFSPSWEARLGVLYLSPYNEEKLTLNYYF